MLRRGTLFLPDHLPINLDPFHRTRNVPLPRSDPVPNHTCAENIGDQLVVLSIPDKQSRTRASSTIQFEKILLLVGGDFDLVLQHASGPQHAHDIGLLSLPEAHSQIRRVLPEVSVRAVDFEFLANTIGENLDLGPDGALVVVQSLEREPQPVVLVAAYVPEQDGGTV